MFKNTTDCTIRPVGPPTENPDGTFTIRGRMAAEGWRCYRLEACSDIDPVVERWLTERCDPDGIIPLHITEMTEDMQRHLTPCETPIRTFVFDLCEGVVRSSR